MGRDKRSKAALHRNHSSAVLQWERRQKISLKPRNHMATHFYAKKRKRRDFGSLQKGFFHHDCKQKKCVQFRDFTDANTNCGFHAPPPHTHAGFLASFFPLFHLLFICNLPVGTSSQTSETRQFVSMPTILHVTFAAKQSHITAEEYSVLQIITNYKRPESDDLICSSDLLILKHSDDFYTQ